MVFGEETKVLSGFATSYLWLLLARVGLGVVTATTGPTVASLTGDYFPRAIEAQCPGLILGGDLLGNGFAIWSPVTCQPDDVAGRVLVAGHPEPGPGLGGLPAACRPGAA